MNNCNCKPGTVPAAPIYNKASACGEPACSLHTVVIPKSKGSDAPGQPNAPIVGGYKNMIVIYESTGSVYLFDEQGIYTSLTGEQLLVAIDALQKQVDASTTQVASMQSALTTEITARQNADTDLQALIQMLQTKLNNETIARETGDSTLQNNLTALEARVNAMSGGSSTEEEERKAADAELQAQIDTLQTQLETETTAREEVDNTLTSNIADLQTSVSDLNTKVNTAVGASANLPASVLQTATISSDATANTVSVSTNGVALEDGAPQTSTSNISLKTINGESIIGTGDIEVEGTGGGTTVDVVQTTGTSTTAVMSQNAVTEAIENVATQVAALPTFYTGTYNTVSGGGLAAGKTTKFASAVTLTGSFPVGKVRVFAALSLGDVSTGTAYEDWKLPYVNVKTNVASTTSTLVLDFYVTNPETGQYFSNTGISYLAVVLP